MQDERRCSRCFEESRLRSEDLTKRTGVSNLRSVITRSTYRRKIVKLPSPSSVLVRFDLRDESHPQCYARRSLSDDPARRLGIQIEGENEEGTYFVVWMDGKGVKAVMKLNTMIDQIEGRTLRESAKLLHRWLPVAKAEGRPASTYTSL